MTAEYQYTSLTTGAPVKYKQDPNLPYTVFILLDPKDTTKVKYVGVTALSRVRDQHRDRTQALQAHINRMLNSARCKGARAYGTDLGNWLRSLKTPPAYAVIADGLLRPVAAKLRTEVAYKHFDTCLNFNVPRKMPKEVKYVAD